MMNRRTFLAGMGCASLSGAATRIRPKQIIDVHTHFYDPSRPQGVPWPGKDESILYKTTLPDRFAKLVKPLGVTGTVAVEASPWLEDNQWVLDLARDDPFVKGFSGSLKPGTPQFKAHVARFSKNPLFRGIRPGAEQVLKGLERPEMLADLQRMVDVDWELDLNGGPWMFPLIVRLADRIPQLRVVINHLPFDPPAEEPARTECRTALQELGRRPQVFAKVSGVLRRVDGRVPEDVAFYRPMLDELWQVFGADRVLYASNWPVSDMLAPYPVVLKVVREYFAEKGQDATDKYFWKNSMAAYKWVAR